MQDNRKLIQMIRLAMYEKNEGREDLRIQRYYKRDYIVFSLIKNFFVVTIGYGLLLAVLLLNQMDFLLNTLKDLNIGPILIAIFTGYIFVLALYSILVWTIRALRYSKARKNVNRYYHGLKKLKKMLQEEEVREYQEYRKSSGRGRQA